VASKTAILNKACAILGLAGMLAGCGGGNPYVLTDYRQHQTGRVEVCYDDQKTSLGQAKALADGICDQYSRVASFQISQRNQCNWRTPDIALFYCVARPGETPPPFVPQKAPLRGGS
jgi:hypothetical protein